MKKQPTLLKKILLSATCLVTSVSLTLHAQEDDDLILDIIPAIVASSGCKGVGTVTGNEIKINAQDFSRNFGAAVGNFDGSAIIRFGTGASVSTRVEYDICVPESGRYKVYLRTWANGHTNNGLFIGVNGKIQRALSNHPLAGSSAIYVFKNVWGTEPQWLQKPSDKHTGPVEIILEKGLQTFVLHKRLIERPYINTIRLMKTG